MHTRIKKIAKPCLLASGICIGMGLGSITSAQVDNLPVLGNAISGTISTQQEYEMGREILRSMRAQFALLSDPLIEEYVASLSYHLAANSELSDHRLSFLLIDSDQLNAFAAPGGIIGVNAGLFLYAENEGQFASVLSHELAHISQRHYARNIEASRANSLTTIATTLASVLIVAAAGGEAGQAALAVSQTMALENQLRFSRSNEQEADRVGIRTLYNAGFDPNDMPGMFENMMQMRSQSRRIPEFLSTHPLDENRVADSRNRAASMPGVEHIQNIEYLLMRQRVLRHYDNNQINSIASMKRELPQLNGIQADATSYGIALAEMRSGQFAAATETLAPLLAKDPNRISYVVLEAQIAQNSGQLDEALAILENHLDINPSNYPLSMAYAETLEASDRTQEAVAVFKTLSQQRPNDINIWYQLAELQGLIGDISGEIGRAHV